MSDIISGIKNGIIAISQLLNQPCVKDGVKKIVGVAHFALGALAVYDICQILNGREISTEASNESEPWKQTALKVIVLFAKFGLVLSALTSPIGVAIISAAVGAFFSAPQLEAVFGANTIFAINPWHPRHVVSIAGAILMAPAAALAIYKAGEWLCHKVCQLKDTGTEPTGDENVSWLSDAKTRVFALFSEATGRPVLHMGNQLASWVIKAV